MPNLNSQEAIEVDARRIVRLQLLAVRLDCRATEITLHSRRGGLVYRQAQINKLSSRGRHARALANRLQYRNRRPKCASTPTS